jgi:hypothetical protein
MCSSRKCALQVSVVLALYSPCLLPPAYSAYTYFRLLLGRHPPTNRLELAHSLTHRSHGAGYATKAQFELIYANVTGKPLNVAAQYAGMSRFCSPGS